MTVEILFWLKVYISVMALQKVAVVSLPNFWKSEIGFTECVIQNSMRYGKGRKAAVRILNT